MALLIPQFVLIAGILVLSLFPKLLMEPVSAAIDPQFASTLVWEGMSLEMIYGYWNPAPVMIAAVAVAVMLGLLARLVRPVPRPDVVNPRRFVILDRLVPGLSMPPVAVFFWREHRERCPCRRGLGAEAVFRQRPDLCAVCPVLRPGHLCCRHGACRAVGGRLSVCIDPAWSGPQCRLALPGLPWSWDASLLGSHAMNLAHRFTSAGLSKCSGTGVGVT